VLPFMAPEYPTGRCIQRQPAGRSPALGHGGGSALAAFSTAHFTEMAAEAPELPLNVRPSAAENASSQAL